MSTKLSELMLKAAGYVEGDNFVALAQALEKRVAELETIVRGDWSRIDILKEELQILRSREEYGWSETAAMEEAERRDLRTRAETAEKCVTELKNRNSYAQGLADAEQIVRRIFDETPGSTTDVYYATVEALRATAEKVKK